MKKLVLAGTMAGLALFAGACGGGTSDSATEQDKPAMSKEEKRAQREANVEKMRELANQGGAPAAQ